MRKSYLTGSPKSVLIATIAESLHPAVGHPLFFHFSQNQSIFQRAGSWHKVSKVEQLDPGSNVSTS